MSDISGNLVDSLTFKLNDLKSKMEETEVNNKMWLKRLENEIKYIRKIINQLQTQLNDNDRK